MPSPSAVDPDSFVFHTSQAAPATLQNCAVLHPDAWNDWGRYRTVYKLSIYDSTGTRFEVGSLKVGRVGLHAEQGDNLRVTIPTRFTELDDDSFSLGQSENYYETLASWPAPWAEMLLQRLRDTAFDLDLFREFRSEHVMYESLLRSVDETKVRRRFHALAHGRNALSSYDFTYLSPDSDDGHHSAFELKFEVDPDRKLPPTNVHAIIGRNGVGKSHLLARR